MNAASISVGVLRPPSADGQSRNADGPSRRDLENSAGVVAADCQHVRARAGEGEVLIEQQLGAAKRDRANDTRVELNFVVIQGIGDGFAQGAGGRNSGMVRRIGDRQHRGIGGDR